MQMIGACYNARYIINSIPSLPWMITQMQGCKCGLGLCWDQIRPR